MGYVKILCKDCKEHCNNHVKFNQLPSLDLRQDSAVSGPGDGVVGEDITKLTPQAQTLGVSTHCHCLDRLHHLGFCRYYYKPLL